MLVDPSEAPDVESGPGLGHGDVGETGFAVIDRAGDGTASIIMGGADGGSIPTSSTEGAVGGRASNCLHSFVPDTEVALADGKRKHIEDVKTGDKVIATDPETGKTTTRRVAATIVTEDDKDFTDLTIKTPFGESSIIATETHPFWSVDKKKWFNAGAPGRRRSWCITPTFR